jgi:hypothetical protein
LFSYFWERVSLYAQASPDIHPPVCASLVAGMTGMYHCTQRSKQMKAGIWCHMPEHEISLYI